MRRLIHDVPKWHVYLHREARELPPVQGEDPAPRKFEDELFDKLYAGGSDKLPANEDVELTEWAERIHGLCEQLPVFQRLMHECRGDADASASAVEVLMKDLTPHLLDSPQDSVRSSVRRSLASACEKASSVVEHQRESMEGLSGVGFTKDARGGSTSAGDSRRLASRLKKDERLARIAMLAGKFKRIAAQKQRSKPRHAVDEVNDVELGSSLSRLLPSELVKLGHPQLRCLLLAALIESRAMQYCIQGPENLGRGPLVVCLDKSGSMEGPRDLWATAVSLALLDIAKRQRRPFALLAFDGDVKHEALVAVGDDLPEQALFVRASGGTSIAAVVSRSLTIICEAKGAMKNADVVLITDGESDTHDAPALKQRAAELGVTVLGLGIGVNREALKPWCDEAHAIERLDTVDEAAADAVFGL